MEELKINDAQMRQRIIKLIFSSKLKKVQFGAASDTLQNQKLLIYLQKPQHIRCAALYIYCNATSKPPFFSIILLALGA